MQSNKPVSISGIAESRVAPVAAYVLKSNGSQGLIIVSSHTRAKRLAEDLSFFVDKNIYVMPESEDIFLHYEARSREQLFERMKALKALRTGEECVVICPAQTALKKLPPHKIYENNSVRLTTGDDVDLENLKENLVSLGYERVSTVESGGQFAMRGGILDIFTPDGNLPYRVEFFDTEIDSIRSFDPITQRSEENLKYIEIYPAEQIIIDRKLFDETAIKFEEEYKKYIKKLSHKLSKIESEEDESDTEIKKEKEKLINAIQRLEQRKDEVSEYIRNAANLQLLENYMHYFYDEAEYIWDYAGEDTVIMIDDPERIHQNIELRTRELVDDFETLIGRGSVIPKDFEIFSGKKEFCQIYAKENVFVFTPFQKTIKEIPAYSALHTVQSKQTPVFAGRMDFLETELKNYVKNGYKVTIVCSSKERLENLSEFISRIGLEGKIWMKEGSLTAGIEFPTEKRCWIWEGDIFSEKKKSSKRKKAKNGSPITSFSDLKKGDYVVHENHGIGKFLGIEKLNAAGSEKDYIKIKYAGEDMLYVPVEQMDIVQKYVGADNGTPKVNKLSGGEWKATKAKAKAAIANMAQELLELSAVRQTEPGYMFSEDSVWQAEFEDSFPYSETDDQLRCIEEIKKDMERPVAMDRLLCGDVGFGKTEVAARAMFKCAADGKQVAVLVPTTLLANQHYYTLKDRFEQFPFTVEMLSRFRSEKQQEQILEKLQNGMIDVIIGTHRLLSKDVKFKDLGLLVIDEEQRFGVEHKEKIKLLRKNVDVLTLSATPIPRTLHMSLVGIKDMSLIEEPPEERYPVQTYVMEQDELVIKEVIERELARDGQVYVLFNRVRGIVKIADMIRDLVPEARVALGHGQMNETQLEQVILDFVNGETNVLVSTTIIESGIDIPNANTILILEADKLGLAQLYQLRGRVGRSNRMAYAYLMYQKDSVLSETAEKRLRAIKDFTEFGAGFKVAMRDLEIRGAGNLLGIQQSGHIMNIGYELYCKLVDDAMRALNGEVINPDREETSIEIATQAYIPDSYIFDEVTKLQMYKKIAAIASADDEDEIIDELLDRFGDPPIQTINLTRISRIKSLAEKLCITRISETRDGRNIKLTFHFAEKNPLKGEKLLLLQDRFKMRVFIHGGVKPFVRYTVEKDKLKEAIEVLELLQQ